MDRDQAIEISARVAEEYLHQPSLNDAQAARIGRYLWANLRWAKGSEEKRKREEARAARGQQ